MKKSELFFNVLRLPVDFVMLLSAGITAYFLRTEIISAFRPVLFEFNLPLLKYFYLVVFVSLIFIGAYAISGLYSLKNRLGLMEEFSKIIIASSASINNYFLKNFFLIFFFLSVGKIFFFLFFFLGKKKKKKKNIFWPGRRSNDYFRKFFH